MQDLWATDGSGIELFRLKISLQRFRFLQNCIRFDDKLIYLRMPENGQISGCERHFLSIIENYKLCCSTGQNVTLGGM